MGARDLTVGLGGLQALRRKDGSARPWLGAAATCDAVDFGATWAAGGGIPRRARSGVLAFAGVLSLLSAIAAVGNGPADSQSPRTVDPADERRSDH